MAIIADAVVSALITGELLLNGKSIQLEPKEWIDLFKYASTHVDGPVKPQLELSGDDEHPIPFTVRVIRASASKPDSQ